MSTETVAGMRVEMFGVSFFISFSFLTCIFILFFIFQLYWAITEIVRYLKCTS